MSGKRCIDCYGYQDASYYERVYLRLMLPWYRRSWQALMIVTDGHDYDVWCCGEHVASLPYFNQHAINYAVGYYEQYKEVTGR